MSAILNGFVIPRRYYTTLLFVVMVKFRPMVFYLFGHPVFIYSAVWFRWLDPVSFKRFSAKHITTSLTSKVVYSNHDVLVY